METTNLKGVSSYENPQGTGDYPESRVALDPAYTRGFSGLDTLDQMSAIVRGMEQKRLRHADLIA